MLRDSLYIPFGGNRLGEAKTWRNLFLTMFLGGLWHDASWRFATCGTLHGVCLAPDKIKNRVHARLARMMGPFPLASTAWRSFGTLLTFHRVAFAWLFFRAPSSIAAIRMARRLTVDSPVILRMQLRPAVLSTIQFWHLALAWLVTIALIDLPQRVTGDRLFVLRWPRPWTVAYLTALLIALLSAQTTSHEAIIYFQFRNSRSVPDAPVDLRAVGRRRTGRIRARRAQLACPLVR